MAKNPPSGDHHRKRAVRECLQTYNLKNQHWVKCDTKSGQFIDQKANEKPFKGVRIEK